MTLEITEELTTLEILEEGKTLLIVGEVNWVLTSP